MTRSSRGSMKHLGCEAQGTALFSPSADFAHKDTRRSPSETDWGTGASQNGRPRVQRSRRLGACRREEARHGAVKAERALGRLLREGDRASRQVAVNERLRRRIGLALGGAAGWREGEREVEGLRDKDRAASNHVG